MIRRAEPFGTRLDAFLDTLALSSESDGYNPRADRVALMTIHASKGLEFPVVFMVGCEEDIMPYRRGDEEPDIEEERRLFYVGMTRAQEKLVLTHAGRRLLFGQMVEKPISRFVNEIEQALLEVQKMAVRKARAKKPDHVQLSLL